MHRRARKCSNARHTVQKGKISRRELIETSLCSCLHGAAGLLQYLYLGVFLFNVTLQVIQSSPTTATERAHVISWIVRQIMIL